MDFCFRGSAMKVVAGLTSALCKNSSLRMVGVPEDVFKTSAAC